MDVTLRGEAATGDPGYGAFDTQLTVPDSELVAGDRHSVANGSWVLLTICVTTADLLAANVCAPL